MAEEMKGTNISSPVVPFTKEDRYATHDETFGRGGYRSVASVSEMNAIPNERRKEGMLINVVGDKIYRLVNGSFVSAFKTINGQSILGSGNVSISGGSGSAEVLKVSLYDIYPQEGVYTISSGDLSYDSIVELDGNLSSGKAIYAYEFAGLMGMFNISIDDMGSVFYLDYLNEKLKIEYTINRDNTITCTVTNITTHDLSMDVKTGYDAAGDPKIYFRIREKVPNGRIHFVRKKKVTYSPMGTLTYHKRVTYAPMFLDVRTAKDTGMDVSNLMENTWYEFPIKADDLIGSYPAGSDIEGSMNKRVYATIRFKGNVHAKPLVYDAPSLTKNLTVLQAGLQYNVLSGQRNPLFKQRGDIVKIDVRLKAKSPTNYNLGYEYNYAVK